MIETRPLYLDDVRLVIFAGLAMIVVHLLLMRRERRGIAIVKEHMAPIITEWFLAEGLNYEVLDVVVPVDQSGPRGRGLPAVPQVDKIYHVRFRDEFGQRGRCWVLPGAGQVEFRWEDEPESVPTYIALGPPRSDQPSPLWDKWLDS